MTVDNLVQHGIRHGNPLSENGLWSVEKEKSGFSVMAVHMYAVNSKNAENLSTLSQNRWDIRKIKISDFHKQILQNCQGA